MKKIIVLMCFYFISCESNVKKENCTVDFKIPEDRVSYKSVITDLKFHENILQVSIYNSKNDTLNFATPHLIFAKEVVLQTAKESDIIVKPFIPNIITDRVTAYYIKKDNSKQIISIDSSKTRDVKQYDFKLAPNEKLVKEYIINCKESDAEKYTIYFFESNRFENNKYEKIKYPENGTVEIVHN